MIRPKYLLQFLIPAVAVVAFSATLLTVNAADADQAKTLLETGSCHNCNLRDAELPGLKATGGDLANSDFRGAMMYRAVLREADLTNSLLSGANLKGADLQGAKGVKFEGAITDEKTTCPSGFHGPCQ